MVKKYSWRWMPVKKKLIIIVLSVQLPMLLAFFSSSWVVRSEINRQLAQTYSQVLSVYKNEIADEFIKADEFLVTTCGSNKISEERREEAQKLLEQNDSLSAVYFYDTYLQKTDESVSWVENQELDLQIQEVVMQSINQEKGWQLFRDQKSGKSYLLRISKGEERTCCIFADAQLVASLAQTKYTMYSPVVFEKNGEQITQAHWTKVHQENVKWLNGGDNYRMMQINGSKYMIVEDMFLAMRLFYAIPYHYNWDWMIYMAVCVFILTLLCFVLAWIVLRGSVFLPMGKLLQTMETIQDEDATVRAEGFVTPEFAKIGTTFNAMLDKLNTLRIESYEQQLEVNRTKINALRLQIRRHFFLNCLKSLYSLTLSADMDTMQQMILKLSTHLRYTLDIETDLVTLRNELKMCENYISLQGLGQPLKPVLHLNIDPRTEEYPVPPVSLLTLLENCCKYAISNSEALEVSITAQCRKLDQEKYLSIILQDNGPGFDQRDLEILNRNPQSLAKEGHVGLVNVLSRFQMLYGENCSMWFINQNGARIEITVPVKEELL